MNTNNTATRKQLETSFKSCINVKTPNFMRINPFLTEEEYNKMIKSWWGTSNRTTLNRSKKVKVKR